MRTLMRWTTCHSKFGRRRETHVIANNNCLALCLRAGSVSWLPGDLAGAAALAHAADVGDECDLGHLAGRIDCNCWRHGPASQQGGDDPRLHRRGVFDYERGWRFRDYRSDAADVQAEEIEQSFKSQVSGFRFAREEP